MTRASIEDRMAIEDLFIRYTTAMDSGDVEGVVGCFTEDGRLDSPIIGRRQGVEQVQTSIWHLPPISEPQLFMALFCASARELPCPTVKRFCLPPPSRRRRHWRNWRQACSHCNWPGN